MQSVQTSERERDVTSRSGSGGRKLKMRAEVMWMNGAAGEARAIDGSAGLVVKW